MTHNIIKFAFAINYYSLCDRSLIMVKNNYFKGIKPFAVIFYIHGDWVFHLIIAGIPSYGPYGTTM